MCDLETSRIGAPYIYDISNLRVNQRAHGKESKNSAMYPCPDQLFYLRIYTRNQASCSTDDGLNLQLGEVSWPNVGWITCRAE
jgi:hypothetical protein